MLFNNLQINYTLDWGELKGFKSLKCLSSSIENLENLMAQIQNIAVRKD